MSTHDSVVTHLAQVCAVRKDNTKSHDPSARLVRKQNLATNH